MRTEIQSLKLAVLSIIFILFSLGINAQTYTFTTGGATGAVGPTQAQLNTAYSGTTLDGAVTSVGGIQEWTVPTSGVYHIEAHGAQGGGANGGLGAVIEGDFMLTQGDVLQIIVGQEGITEPGSPNSVGGGGGSFVVEAPGNDTSDILLIAGGGGGSPGTIHPGRDATAATSGNNGYVDAGVSNPDGIGGSNGNGGNKSVSGCSLDRGAGGGGFLTDGGSICQTAGNADGGSSFLNGGQGGTHNSSGAEGGFGGGGAVWSTGFRGSGGGGGFSGGGGGQINTDNDPGHSGGGGGSYNTGMNQVNNGGVNSGDGLVVISALSTGAQNDAGAISVDSPSVYCPGTEDVVVTVQNFGANQITSLEVHWEINGTPQPTFNFTGTLDTIGGTGAPTAQINLGSFTFTAALYNIDVWTENPNGVPDTVNMNDSVSTQVQSSLPPPTNLATTAVTGNSVSFSWTGGSLNNSWLYSVVPTGNIPGIGTQTTQQNATVANLTPLSDYDIYVRELCPGASDTSAWAGPVTFTTPFLCPANGFCFTTAGATGAVGPTQTEVDNEYVGTNLDGSVSSVNGYQEWIVPQTGDYKIIAFGAEGGGLDSAHRGQGGRAEGIVTLVQGEVVYVAVGQAGQYGHNASAAPPGGFNGGGDGGSSGCGNYGSSGGGASDVRIGDTTLTSRLIVAGGGGGATGDGIESWRCGGGGGGGGGYYGGGGGQGGNESPTGPGQGGAQTAGGTGGGTSSGNTDGGLGFGGHGGNTTYSSTFTTNSNVYGGDGGGLQGQDGGQNSTASRADGGGGGSSYIGGLQTHALTSTSTTTGFREGHGLVIIEALFPLQPPAPNDAGVFSIDAPDFDVACQAPTDVIVTVRNFGSDLLGSFDVTFEVDGVVQNTVSYSGPPLDTAMGSGSPTVQLNVGSYAFDENRTYEIKAYTSTPNGVTDTVNINDTTVKVIQANVLEAQITDTAAVSCHGGSDGFAAGGSASDSARYFWSVGDTGKIINTLPAGEHLLVVEDDGFTCNDTVSFVITQPDELLIEKESGGATCQGTADGFLKVDGIGGTPPYNFTWSNGLSRSAISGLTQGNYRVTVTDSNGCTSMTDFDVVNPQILRTAIDTIAPANCTNEEGFVNLSTTGGLQPYSYEWSGGQTSANPTGMPGGEYTVTVTDDAGCTNVLTLNVPELNTNIGFNKPDTLFAMEDDLVDIEWINCETGEVVDDSGDKEFVPGIPGSYAFVMTKGNCSATSPCVDVIYTTGVEDAAQNFESVEVFPNPSSGKFNLRITGNSNEAVEIELLDMQGKVLMTDRIGSLSGEMVKEINTTFASGVYLIKITSGKQPILKRLVIQ